MNFVDHLLFYMKLLNYLFCDMFGSVLECYELTYISFTVHSRESCMSEQALLPHWLCNLFFSTNIVEILLKLGYIHEK